MLGLACGLAGAWLAWAVFARISLYEITTKARLEVDRAAHAVQSPFHALVTETQLAIGREVRAGDLLVELETRAEELELASGRARLQSAKPQLAALHAQLAAEQRTRDEERLTAFAAEDETRAQLRRAQAAAQFSAAEANRIARLRAAGLIAEREAERAAATAAENRAEVERDELTVRRLERERHTRESERDARISQLRARIAELEGFAAGTAAAINRLQYEIERRSIRAPISGRIAEAAILRPGAVLAEGEKVASIVPAGGLVVIAEFPPAAAIGRVRRGHHATVRFDGFPWAQYGSLRAEVVEVANEIRNGTVRVELAVASGQQPRIPLQHGLTGSVEVEVERITPAALLVRHAGTLLTTSRSAHESPEVTH